MMKWNEVVEKYIVHNSDRIRKVTQSLLDLYGISYFTYHRIDLQGHYTVLVDRPDWAEHYVSNQYYAMDPYLRHPSRYQSGLTLMGSHGSPEYRQKVIHEGGDRFQMDLGLIHIERKPNAVEFFGYSGKQGQCALSDLVLQQPGLLKSFATYFKEEMKAIRRKMRDAPIFLPFLKGEDFFATESIHPQGEQDSHHQFLTALGYGDLVRKAESLSHRERQCLQHLLQGHQAKETAVFLDLSPRTVEFYLENIKAKLGCRNKGELFSLAQTFQKLHLLSIP